MKKPDGSPRREKGEEERAEATEREDENGVAPLQRRECTPAASRVRRRQRGALTNNFRRPVFRSGHEMTAVRAHRQRVYALAVRPYCLDRGSLRRASVQTY